MYFVFSYIICLPLTYGDVFRGAKDEVHQYRIEGGVETKHRWDRSQKSVCHT